MTDNPELERFRLNWRLNLIERLVLRTVLVAPVLARQMSLEESTASLLDWLEQNSKAADEGYGKIFQDPGLTALYADEVKSVTDDMKMIVANYLTRQEKYFVGGHDTAPSFG